MQASPKQPRLQPHRVTIFGAVILLLLLSSISAPNGWRVLGPYVDRLRETTTVDMRVSFPTTTSKPNNSQPTNGVEMKKNMTEMRVTKPLLLPLSADKCPNSHSNSDFRPHNLSTSPLPPVQPNPKSGACSALDTESKLMIRGAPKGGCMLVVQLLISQFGLLQDAIEFNGKDSFRSVFSFWHQNLTAMWDERGKKFVNPRFSQSQNRCQERCKILPGDRNQNRKDDWICIKLARSPLNRLVSAYIHAMSMTGWIRFKELGIVANQTANHTGGKKQSTFGMFVKALQLRSQNPNFHTGLDNHFLPQSEDLSCDARMHYLVPLETVQESLDFVNLERNLTLNASGLSSSHYVNKSALGQEQEVYPDASKLPPPARGTEGRKSLPYDAYFQDAEVNAAACALFCIDFQFYAEACWQMVERTNTAGFFQNKKTIWDRCEVERQRFVKVCGVAYDFFGGASWQNLVGS